MTSSDGGATQVPVARPRHGVPDAPGPRWELGLLGGWLLEGPAGVTADVPMRERRLLGLLALHGRRSRPHLAALLWPDSAPTRAHGNLRAAVWHVQHRHPGLLEGEHGAIRLSPAVRVDVHALRAAIATLEAEGPPPSCEGFLDLLGHDELLPGWDEAWVAEERAPLHQHRLRALETLAGILLERGDLAGALTAAHRAVTLDPLRESAHRALIRVHLEDGNHAEAVRIYRSYRGRVRDELGVEVSPRLVALVAQVHQAAAAPDGRAVGGVSAPQTLALP
ncbi:DNA-binding SARP family transcriptional activator [Georgenia muralis]|uniref:DNA-binding SARP family transcriptional activator n=2 Tax=Georgenia muralis TaxID=154117 RepID=A0A3N5A6S5_9MICO|nr:DNA-binding SARP family transcriptional activator [Georgenia muralis]